MAHWISMFCIVLSVIHFCESVLPDGKDCPAEASIASKLNKSETETVLECPCIERLCLPLCCPIGSLMIKHDCTPVKNISALEFPPHHDPRTLEKRPEQLSIHDFHVFSWNPCQDDDDRYQLEPEENPDDEYKLLANGSIYLPVFDKTIDFTNYCFGAIDNTSVYIIVLCFNDYFDDNTAATVETKITVALPVGMILSVPFLLVTFVVYSVIPELRNMHGATLRGYIGPLIVAYINLAIVQITPNHKINDSVCTFLAFVIHFSFLASFFWLNVMCFDIWWTFGEWRQFSYYARGYVIVRCVPLDADSRYTWRLYSDLSVVNLVCGQPRASATLNGCKLTVASGILIEIERQTQKICIS